MATASATARRVAHTQVRLTIVLKWFVLRAKGCRGRGKQSRVQANKAGRVEHTAPLARRMQHAHATLRQAKLYSSTTRAVSL